MSPLLANLYMRRFVLGWKVCGHGKRLDAHIVNYADDFVICCKPGTAEKAMTAMRGMMEKLRLTVNERKTRCCGLPDGAFTFLGYTFGRHFSRKAGWAYVAPAPAKKKIQAICKTISEETGRQTLWQSSGEKVTRLNRILRGWGNYFRVGAVTGAWAVVQQHACRRLRRWVCRKHGQAGSVRGYPNMLLYEKYGLMRLTVAIQRIPL